MSWAIIARRTAQSENEIYTSGIITEHAACMRANIAYKSLILDCVIVLEVVGKDFHVVYKRERRCKHTNVQYAFDVSGEAMPRCEACGLVMRPIEMEVVNESELG
jgi:hypothetical protein